jgi:hypothetical protein
MIDVLNTIREIHHHAAGAETAKDLADACEQAELLLLALRRQFVIEVVLGHPETQPPQDRAKVEPSQE